VTVGQPAHAVGTKQSRHVAFRGGVKRCPETVTPHADRRGALPETLTASSAGVHPEAPGGAQHAAQDQRLENCGALRAFLRPAFLRSITRASRVSSPAFLSVGRLASTSTALSARATPRRRAPA